LEIGDWRLEIGDWRLEIGERRQAEWDEVHGTALQRTTNGMQRWGDQHFGGTVEAVSACHW
jgi:hypothetical protein